ncbi:SF1B family DNA helicase RecD2 [Clostridiisalibacter paucivorans]|uniref:SF1B family DNA helicase RecD2 n=1 Tax=Clostridiisalibacter paucivorans TaxID=408753 RepID=UPI000478DC55|nr:ATP-dependent RecD-like DNA helicase [Clostridiisalibacter paucivorans]
MVSVQGTVEEIIFQNESNGYTVAILENDEDVVTIVGVMPMLNIGETLEIHGQWEQHPSYGEQLKVEVYTEVIPATLKGIERYLSSGLISGIGPKTAKNIVNTFGTEALEILQYSPHRLKEISGIGEKKANRIAEAFQEQRELKDVMLFLQGYGISPTYGIKIYKKYGNETISKVKENPYRLVEDIFGIGFKMADNIAQSMGIQHNSKYRINAGVKYVLMDSSTSGHTYIPKEILLDKAVEILKVEKIYIEESIKELALKQHLKLEDIDGEICVYYIPFYYAEVNVSKKLVELSRVELNEVDMDIDQQIVELEQKSGIRYAENQKEAIKEALLNGVLIVTGGPGTGKTTTINSIIKLLESQGYDIELAAPTGRAAKRMSEATGKEARTLHRLLEYSFMDDMGEMAFGKNEESPLDTDVIIVDEVSMVDILLMNSLSKAIMPGTRLILVGDVDQLPSVGPGNVLRDIIDSGIIKVVELNEIFRQAQESMIVVNAHKINKGEPPRLNVRDKDFFFIRQNNPQKILDTILGLCKDRLPNFNGYDPLKDIQVLTPMKKGDVGVNSLNQNLQRTLNPEASYKDEKKQGDQFFRVGDKIMQVKNNYRTKWKQYKDDGTVEEGEGVFNGDFGYIMGIDDEEGEVMVQFDDNREVNYPFGQLDELKLAYATTIHKSQGSEFPVVIIPICWGPPMLLTRNLLYTAVTRARELVVLVGMERYLYMMIKNNRINKRYSALDNRIFNIFNIFVNK